MSTLSAYLQTWRLKLSHTKMVMAAFHLNNREAKCELKVYNNDRLLPFCPTPTYLWVKLDRLLTFHHHLVALRKKLSLRVTLLRRLVGSEWGAGAKTLRIATLSLVYSTAEYCAPVWCRSAHTRLIDSVLNDALCIVYNNDKLLPFCPTPTYLGVKLDTLLTFCHHLVALCKKLSLHITLLRQLVGSRWGADAKMLPTAILSLAYSIAEYCAPVWCHSAHTRLIDSVLNDTLHIVTGCLHPTPTDYLPILSGIQPAELH